MTGRAAAGAAGEDRAARAAEAWLAVLSLHGDFDDDEWAAIRADLDAAARGEEQAAAREVTASPQRPGSAPPHRVPAGVRSGRRPAARRPGAGRPALPAGAAPADPGPGHGRADGSGTAPAALLVVRGPA